jgi:hypothetical protein
MCIVGLLNAAEFYVSPNGDDENSGDKANPFATLERARIAVRTVNSNMSDHVVVYLREGIYFLKEPFILDANDGGDNDYYVIYRSYPDEKVIISGGEKITGWEENSPMFVASANARMFRQLYVNDKPAQMAESESIGNGSAQEMLRLTLGGWGISYLPLDESGNIRQSVQECFDALVGIADFLGGELGGYRNSPSFVDEPGEWAIDPKEDKVYYYPRAGESVDEMDVYVPAVDQLVRIAGDSRTAMAQYILFQNICFAHASWSAFETDGFCSVQAGHGMTTTQWGHGVARGPSGITVENAHHIRFEGCEIKHMACGGIDMPMSCHDNAIVGCTFREIAGNGISIGPINPTGIGSDVGPIFNPEDELLLSLRILVENNLVKKAASAYKGCVGIFAGNVTDVSIAHNEVCSLSYTGMSVGWGWCGAMYDPNAMRDNDIRYNFVHDVMLELIDGAAIYTLSPQTNSTITGNYVRNVPKGTGLYLDECTHGYTIKHNVMEFVGGGSYCFGFGINSWYNKVDSNHINWPHEGVNGPQPPDSVYPMVTYTFEIETLGNNWGVAAQEIIDNAGIEDDIHYARAKGNTAFPERYTMPLSKNQHKVYSVSGRLVLVLNGINRTNIASLKHACLENSAGLYLIVGERGGRRTIVKQILR